MESRFVTRLKDLIDEKYPGRRSFIRAAEPGLTQKQENAAQAYLAKVLKGLPPILDRVEMWAQCLGLKADEKQEFIDLARIAHLPDQASQELFFGYRERLSLLERIVSDKEKGPPRDRK